MSAPMPAAPRRDAAVPAAAVAMPVRNEIALLLTLAAMQFTHIVDFMIVMPLGPQFMRLFAIDPQHFGFLVSAYTFAAAASGFVAAFWVDRFGLSLDPADTGYGHRAEDVAAVRAPADLLVGYHGAVAERTRRYVAGLGDADLDRVVDERWDPPVTLGARLVSVIGDDMAHLGQAQFVKGLLERAGS